MIENDSFNIRVVKANAHKDAIYCGRGSPLGNPFPMHGDESKRDEVCDQHQEYFEEALAEGNDQIEFGLMQCVKYAFENGYVKLGCYCAPRRCHCDVIAQHLEGILNP
jgi:hypothetical protein